MAGSENYCIGKEFIAIAAREMNASPKFTVLPVFLIKLLGLFIPFMRELGEMLYQNKDAYIFDSSKFEKAFNIQPTPYEEGIKQTARYYIA